MCTHFQLRDNICGNVDPPLAKALNASPNSNLCISGHPKASCFCCCWCCCRFVSRSSWAYSQSRIHKRNESLTHTFFPLKFAQPKGPLLPICRRNAFRPTLDWQPSWLWATPNWELESVDNRFKWIECSRICVRLPPTIPFPFTSG